MLKIPVGSGSIRPGEKVSNQLESFIGDSPLLASRRGCLFCSEVFLYENIHPKTVKTSALKELIISSYLPNSVFMFLNK